MQRPIPDGTHVSGLGWAWTDGVDSWTWDVDPATRLIVEVYSDADEVELLLDERSVGIAPAGPIHRIRAEFEVAYEPGELVAVARRAGQPTARAALRTTGGPLHSG